MPIAHPLTNTSIDDDEQNATGQDHYGQNNNHRLRLPPTLHQSSLMTILSHCIDIITKTIGQTYQTENPEDQTQRKRHPSLQQGGLTAKMERDYDSDRHNGEVHGKTDPRKKGAFIGAVIAGV